MKRTSFSASILKHYFRTIHDKLGLKWDSDSDAEIDEITESIYERAYYDALEDARSERKGLGRLHGND